MIDDDAWKEILSVNCQEEDLLKLSKKYKIPMSFIVGRLAKMKMINYKSEIYNKYKER